MKRLLLIAFLIPQIAWAGTPQIIFAGTATNTNATNSEFYNIEPQSGSFSTTENSRWSMIPVAGTWSNLRVRASTALLAGSYTITFRTSSASSLITCTLDTSNQTCQDIVNSSTTVAGEVVDINVVPTGTPTQVFLQWSLQFSPTSANNYFVQGNNQNALNTAVTFYESLVGYGNVSSQEDANKQVWSPASTINVMYVQCNGAPGVGTSFVFTVNQNKVASSMACTVSGSGKVASDTGGLHNITVSPGDTIDVSIAKTGAPSSAACAIGLGYTATTPGEFQIGDNHQTGTLPSAAAVNYTLLNSQNMTFGTTEANFSTLGQTAQSGMKLYNYYVLTDSSTSPGSMAYIVRKNAATNGPGCTVTATTCSDLSTQLSISNDDLLTQRTTPTSSPTVGDYHTGMTGFVTPTPTGGGGYSKFLRLERMGAL